MLRPKVPCLCTARRRVQRKTQQPKPARWDKCGKHQTAISESTLPPLTAPGAVHGFWLPISEIPDCPSIDGSIPAAATDTDGGLGGTPAQTQRQQQQAATSHSSRLVGSLRSYSCTVTVVAPPSTRGVAVEVAVVRKTRSYERRTEEERGLAVRSESGEGRPDTFAPTSPPSAPRRSREVARLARSVTTTSAPASAELAATQTGGCFS
eukprot:COSAG01_NODE_8865_length_2632_cov_7.701540_2_plen_208_part_00